MIETSKCKSKSCGVSVLWVETVAGKRMPLDPVPVPNGNIVFVPDRPLTVRYLRAKDVWTGLKYQSHFASCKDADQWRRKDAGKAINA